MPVPTVMYAHDECGGAPASVADADPRRHSASAGAFTSVSNASGKFSASRRPLRSGPSTSVFRQPALGVVVM